MTPTELDYMDDDDKFKFVEPFDVDDGSLDGLSPTLIFVLGVEWQMAHQALSKPAGFQRPIHSENVQRIKNMCDRHKRQWDIMIHDDWPTLIVEAKE